MEYIREVIVEVQVEKIIEVPVLITIEKPIFKEIIIEEEVIVETNPVDIVEDPEEELQEREYEDPNLQQVIN